MRGVAMDSQFDLSHWIGHAVSSIAVVGAILGILPAAAALAGLIWYAIQIWESNTVSRWRRTRAERRLTHHRAAIAKLEAKIATGDIAARKEALDAVQSAKVAVEKLPPAV